MQSGREQLTDWIARRGFNQTEAAEYLGLHKAEISYYVNGVRTPGLETAVLIERLSGIPVEAWTSAVHESNQAARDAVANS